jgi:hypothetical protein
VTSRRLLTALLVAALPSGAELRRMWVQFTPSECASCTQSLPERLMRIRGIAGAKLLEAKPPLLEVVFAPSNRVRMHRVREVIEQDGARWLKGDVEAAGTCEKQADGWLLKLFDQDSGVALKEWTQPGACQVKGVLDREGVLTAK